VKRQAKALLRWAGYELTRTDLLPEHIPDVTENEWRIYKQVRPYTMLSLERILANIRAVEHVVNNRISGDIVECGVWRGGSSMAMALAVADQSRNFWMFDTYSGMTEATDADFSNTGIKASVELAAARKREVATESHLIAFASLEDVKRNLQLTGYPSERIRFIQGPVEETIPRECPEKIAILRLDTDWYESTRHELEHLYPRLAPGGLLILDDYGYWQGARKAVDEYFAGKLFLSRIDFTGRIAVKP
jgi:O-methyltransferase